MTRWYDPVPLMRIALRVIISSVFGAFADRRELVAAVNPVADKPFDPAWDYADKAKDDRFWIDFVADTGDGWRSSHAVAQVASAPVQTLGGEEMPRGDLLIFGGDQVYPTASMEAYAERFLEPWNLACSELGQDPEQPARGDLYAIPGNHDWYDGLIAFSHIFARRTASTKGTASVPRKGKVIAGRQTQQVRSYFALQLPHDWWLWGTDSQIEGMIDQPQVDYFRFVAANWMKRGSKLILCVGQPSWTYVDPADPAHAFNSFSFLSRIVTSAVDDDGQSMDHQLKLVLTGDAHHYSRYVEDGCQYVTAGGGGAFLHPTHHLRPAIAFDWGFPSPNQPWQRGDAKVPRRFNLARRGAVAGEDAAMRGEEFAVFPNRKTSSGLAWRNLGFAALNPQFAGLYLLFYALLIWSIEQRIGGHGGGADSLIGQVTGDGTAGVVEAFSRLSTAALGTPWAAMLLFMTLGVYVYAVDETRQLWRRVLIGLMHGAAQVGLFLAAASAVMGVYAKLGIIDWQAGPTLLQEGIGGAVAAAAAALASATLFGVYLLASLQLLHRHWNEAFSSLRIRNYKNFLRMRIDQDGLTLFPIGLADVPAADVPAHQLKPQLIEAPVRIT